MKERAFLAAILSMIFLTAYSQFLISRSPAPKPTVPGASPAPSTEIPSLSARVEHERMAYILPQEDVTSLESSEMVVDIGLQSGAIRAVTLRRFVSEEGHGPVVLKPDVPLISPRFHGTASLPAQVEALGNQVRAVWRDEGKEYHILYSLAAASPLLSIEMQSDIDLPIIVSWMRVDQTPGNQNKLEAIALTVDSEERQKYEHVASPLKKAKNVPRGTLMLALSERYFCQSIKFASTPKSVRILPSQAEEILAEVVFPGSSQSQVASVYFGSRDYFQLDKWGFTKAFPVGIIGQIGLALLLFLSWVEQITGNYGIAIILFSGTITLLMAPFTLMGMRSMKRMQELKPKVDRIMQEHKNDPMKSREVLMKLYKEHHVHPMGGCLPMLLQIPVFIALYQAISHFVPLRGATFLWMKDLSLPDRLAVLPFALPVLGSNVNLLPAIMAGLMFLQTKLSQKASGAQSSDPTAQIMSGPLMPIMFFVMFYHFPAGLVLYWLTNSVFSVLVYRLAK